MTELTEMKLSEIHPYARNPRRNDESVEAVAMMELDPIYCDVIIKRWENLTGRTAERVAP